MCLRTAIAIFFVQIAALNDARGQTKYSFERPAMGSPFTITIETGDSLAAARAAAEGFRLTDTLNGMLSDYVDSSEINRLSATSGRGRFIIVSPPLFDILRRAQEAARMSQGRYDITVGPVVRLWRKARKTGVPPAPDEIAAALKHTGYRYLHLDTTSSSVWLEKPGMQLDVGGLGKGFVAQAVLQRLAEWGFPVAMVNAGGKIVAGASPAGRAGWIIGINAPGEKERLLPLLLSLRQMAVATSGDIYQYMEWRGRRYSHIIDPRTGIGLTRRRNVTAIAGDGTTADWLATACSILSYRQALKLLRRFPGAALLVTEMKHGEIIQKSSVNFKKYQLPDAPASSASPVYRSRSSDRPDPVGLLRACPVFSAV
ncbi:MAG TPA: FAD:protein FMN transferase [Puia sp.]|jgi:thiamine biosynthesis lipoprotein|nr:FAD:protein FMN transferase [Puia sp.]